MTLFYLCLPHCMRCKGLPDVSAGILLSALSYMMLAGLINIFFHSQLLFQVSQRQDIEDYLAVRTIYNISLSLSPSLSLNHWPLDSCNLLSFHTSVCGGGCTVSLPKPCIASDHEDSSLSSLLWCQGTLFHQQVLYGTKFKPELPTPCLSLGLQSLLAFNDVIAFSFPSFYIKLGHQYPGMS